MEQDSELLALRLSQCLYFCSSLLILFLVLYYHNTLHNEG